MSVSKQNQRVSARVPLHVYDMLAQAAELSGATINQFLVQSAIEKAQNVVERERFIRMTTYFLPYFDRRNILQGLFCSEYISQVVL